MAFPLAVQWREGRFVWSVAAVETVQPGQFLVRVVSDHGLSDAMPEGADEVHDPRPFPLCVSGIRLLR